MADSTSRPLFFSRTYDFLVRYMPEQCGRSPETVDSYRDALTVFRRYIHEELGMSVATMLFEDCTKELLLGFVASMRARGCSAGTCNQRISAINSYLGYCADEDVALQPIALAASHVPRQKGPEAARDPMTEEAVVSILAAPDAATPMGARDLAILVVLYDTAMRVSELVGLDVGSVSGPPDAHARVWGKGSKERVVGMSDRCWEHVEAHIARAHGDEPDPAAPLFYTKYAGEVRRMSRSNVERIVKKYAGDARETCQEVPDSVFPHLFRGTRATELYRSGVALEVLARLMGHAKIETTKVYARPSAKMLHDVVQSASQLEPQVPVWEGNEDEMARLCGLR